MPVPVKRLSWLVAALAASLAGSAFAGDIYKWTDAEGIVHYGDRAPENVDAQRLAINSRPTDRARVAATMEARRDARRRLVESPDDEEQSDAPSPEEQKQLAEERAQKCSMYKDRLQTFLQSRRLYRQDESGERVYLSEQEIQEARADVQDKIQEFCND